MKQTLGIVLIAGYVAGIGGCGDDSGDGTAAPGQVATGLPPGQSLGTLTQADAEQLCQASSRAAQELMASAEYHSGSCKLAGVMMAGMGAAFADPPPPDSELQQTCKTMYDQCMSAQPQSTESSGTCTPPPATCTATVAEYEACMEASLRAMKDVYAALPGCEEITAASLQTSTSTETSMTASQPPECQAFSSKCSGYEATVEVPETTTTG